MAPWVLMIFLVSSAAKGLTECPSAPAKVQDFRVASVTTESLSVSWKAPNTTEDCRRFVVYFLEEHRNYEETRIVQSTELKFDNLLQCHCYDIYVAQFPEKEKIFLRSSDIKLKSNSTLIWDRLTPCTSMIGNDTVQTLTITSITATGVKFNWSPPPINRKCYEKTSKYLVQLHYYQGRLDNKWNTADTSLSLIKLHSCTAYTITVVVMYLGNIESKRHTFAHIYTLPEANLSKTVNSLNVSEVKKLCLSISSNASGRINASTTQTVNNNNTTDQSVEDIIMTGLVQHKLLIAIALPVVIVLLLLTTLIVLLRYRGITIGRNRWEISPHWCCSEDGSPRNEEYTLSTISSAKF